MKRYLDRAAAAALVLCLCACGSTSHLERTEGEQGAETKSIASYDTIVIGDFANQPKKPPVKPEHRAAYDEQVARAGTRFGELIEERLRSYRMRGVTIVRGAPRPGALVLDGDITRYRNGNAALRLLIGFGAGSSYFDATVRFRDADTGHVLGSVDVDKNSWPLGGGLAAFQTGEAELAGAASRVAEEIAFARGVIRKRGNHKLAHPPTACGRGGPNCGKAARP